MYARPLLLAALLVGCSDDNPGITPTPDGAVRDAPTSSGADAPASASAPGTIARLEVVSTADAYGGMTFGTVGAYEVVTAIAHGTLDPHHAANAGIADIALAPTNADGMVDYTTDVVILRPKVPANAKRVVFYDVVNRGNNLAASFIDNGGIGFGAGKQGDALLLRLGYTLIWSGWQGDIAQTGHGDSLAIGTVFPVAHNAGNATITGTSREEFISDTNSTTLTMPLGYPAADMTDKASVAFSFRESWLSDGKETYTAPSTAIAAASWSYADAKHVTFTRPAGADNSAIYEFVYTAKDPIVMGIGFAAVRDIMAFLRSGKPDGMGTVNPLNSLQGAPCAVTGCDASKSNFDVAIMEGVSQSGRFARDFLYQGFNDDGSGHKVFEGMIPIIAGSRKTWTNFRFAQPGRFSRMHEDHFQRNDQFPFGYGVTTDPVSGASDGLFKKCQASTTCPNVMHIDGGYETWGARGLLVSTNGQGIDVTVPDTVRLYVIPGVNHGGGNGVGTQTMPPSCVYTNSPISERSTIRALVPAMEAWLSTGTAPPASQWPSVTGGTAALASDQAAVSFPDIAGVTFGGTLFNQLFVTDYTNAVPVVSLDKGYMVMVSKTDDDGNDVAGVRLPDLAAPIATYQSWNRRASNFAPGDQCSTNGAMIPFAATDGARPEGDSRMSLAARYSSHADYVTKVTNAANALVTQKLLLQEDVAFFVTAAQAASIP